MRRGTARVAQLQENGPRPNVAKQRPSAHRSAGEALRSETRQRLCLLHASARKASVVSKLMSKLGEGRTLDDLSDAARSAGGRDERRARGAYVRQCAPEPPVCVGRSHNTRLLWPVAVSRTPEGRGPPPDSPAKQGPPLSVRGPISEREQSLGTACLYRVYPPPLRPEVIAGEL
ncbi:hypothetical protein AAFF_G00041990 [Aldrovandia affinis]|uniref:Uncharacterized protein n=1 Tax=Aldrovandia affinis TaxID=143900 RepID=A0AAD7WG85_9TELE|nr:hypothetical protein AAFF_G00041990 [Aldrovandia affinis]